MACLCLVAALLQRLMSVTDEGDVATIGHFKRAEEVTLKSVQSSLNKFGG